MGQRLKVVTILNRFVEPVGRVTFIRTEYSDVPLRVSHPEYFEKKKRKKYKIRRKR